MYDIESLIKQAMISREMAYAPYSNFKVGAAVLTKSNKIFSGCNVENSSYGATICAERSAITAAVTDGEKCFYAIAIIASAGNYCFPCGICRRVLSEFSKDGEIDVITCKPDGDFKIYKLKDLLPEAFLL
jgi:cytidine deaminase